MVSELVVRMQGYALRALLVPAAIRPLAPDDGFRRLMTGPKHRHSAV